MVAGRSAPGAAGSRTLHAVPDAVDDRVAGDGGRGAVLDADADVVARQRVGRHDVAGAALDLDAAVGVVVGDVGGDEVVVGGVDAASAVSLAADRPSSIMKPWPALA